MRTSQIRDRRAWPSSARLPYRRPPHETRADTLVSTIARTVPMHARTMVETRPRPGSHATPSDRPRPPRRGHRAADERSAVLRSRTQLSRPLRAGLAALALAALTSACTASYGAESQVPYTPDQGV